MQIGYRQVQGTHRQVQENVGNVKKMLKLIFSLANSKKSCTFAAENKKKQQ